LTKKRINSGYKYLKTGDLSGDLCRVCDRPMFIDKTGERKEGQWTLRCHCGREIPFVSNAGYGLIYK
jgi:hypothetical protein